MPLDLSQTGGVAMSRTVVIGIALLVLGFTVGTFLPLGLDDARLEKQNGDLVIQPGDEIGYFEQSIASTKESTASFIVEELYWEDGSRSGYGAPPCLDENGDGDVQEGVVYVGSAGGYQQVAWVHCQ